MEKYPVPKELAERENFFVHEYSIDELLGNIKIKHIMPKDIFCVRNIGAIKYTIWSN